MEAQFRISVQHGKGPHYFMCGVHDSVALAANQAASILDNIQRRIDTQKAAGKRTGPKPTVRVWKLEREFTR